MKIGNRIKELRKSKGLTQKQLAEKVDVNAVTITRYENDDREPNLGTLQLIAETLNVTVNELLKDTDESKKMHQTIDFASKAAEEYLEKISKDAFNGIKYLAVYASLEDELSMLSNNDEVISLLDKLSIDLEYELYKIAKNKEVNK